MHVRLLGQIEAVDGDPLALGGPTQRRVLAALALRRNEVVSVAHLVDVIWSDDEPPERAEHNVRTYVHRLRSSLDGNGDRVETVGAGYLLRLGADELDAATFEQLAGTARRLADTGDGVAALDLLDEAERLWRGDPLAEFENEAWAMPDAVRLRELHTELQTQRAAALIELGRAATAVAPLEALVRDEPLREGPRALLMRALYESGRQAEALRAFQEFRRSLIDEVGVEPSTDLVELDRAIATGALTPGEERIRSVGGYELHERIGEGAFAIVHRATQAALGREVAVKIIRAELANRPEFIRRFEAEAQMVARVEHPSVVPLYDYWREPDRAFLVMRWMTGGSLETRLDDGPWTIDDTLALVDEIAAALDAAHSQGVVHRDVKPENILFDEAGRAYLGDFGIALDAAERSRPEAALSEGSPVFASPEQLRREPVGPEADVHALAIVVFTLLAGRTPFADTFDEPTRLQRQLHEPIPSVRATRPELPAGVDEVLAVATAKRASDRHPTAPAFAAALRAAVRSETSASSVPVRTLRPRANPYKGLRAFDETDSADFHGRERLVDELIDHLGQSDNRLLAVVGPSGSGKSSVVRAGLIPALRNGRVGGSSQWFATTLIPGARPFEALETALLRIAVNPPSALLDQLRDGDRGILRAVKRVLPGDDDVVAVTIDQFEELFTGAVPDDDRDLFLRALAVAATEPGSPVRFVITLRADFYDRPLRHPEFAPLLKRHTVVVTPLAPDELEHAIVTPAAAVGVGFEPGLVAEMIADVNHEPGALPLLQYALTQVFDATEGDTVTIDAYRSIGGLAGALGTRAEELWQSANDDEREAARRLFGRLVTLGEGVEDTRRRAHLSEIGDDDATRSAIDRFGRARLLTFDHDPATREPTLEIAHEALIREWPRLRDWLDDDRDTLRTHRHLTVAAAGWLDRDRDSGELYRGARLAAAGPLLAGDTVTLNPTEEEFLRTSLQRRDDEAAAERARLRRLRRLVMVTAIVAAIALVAGSIALLQWRRADDQAAEAAASEAVAITNSARAEAAEAEAESNAEQADLERLRAVAQAEAPNDPGLATLLSVEAYRLDPSIESLDALHRVLTAVPGYDGFVVGSEYLGGELLDDDTQLVAVGADSIDVWDLRDRELFHSVPHANDADTVQFDVTGDGRLVAARSGADTTVFYDLEAEREIGRIQHESPVNDISLSRDGATLATAGTDGRVEIWDVSSRSLDSVLEIGSNQVTLVEWSPTTDELVAVTVTSEVQWWDPAGGEPIWSSDPLEGAASEFFLRPEGLTFTPDGRHVAMLSGDSIVRVFDVTDGSLPFAPTVVQTEGVSFAFDSLFWIDADALIIAVPYGGGIESFDLRTGEPVATEISGASFAGWVYSRTLDRYVGIGRAGLSLWSRDGSGPLERVVPLTDEQQEAIVTTNASVHTSLAADRSRLIVSVFAPPAFSPTMSYDLRTDPPTAEVFDASGPVTIGFGEYTMTASFEGIRILDADLNPLGPGGPTPVDFNEVAASPDGRFYAVGRSNGLVDLHTSSGELLATLTIDPDGEVPGAIVIPSFTSDGELLAGTTTDGLFAVWSTDTLERVAIDVDGVVSGSLAGPWLWALRTDDGAVVRIDPATSSIVGAPLLPTPFGGYSRLDEANMRLAGVGVDDVRVLDIETDQQIGREMPYAGIRIEWSADGSLLSIPGDDRVTLWNFDTESWDDVACEVAGRNLTREEWEAFGPRTTEYRATCDQYPLL